jgi:hypothetical protein
MTISAPPLWKKNLLAINIFISAWDSVQLDRHFLRLALMLAAAVVFFCLMSAVRTFTDQVQVGSSSAAILFNQPRTPRRQPIPHSLSGHLTIDKASFSVTRPT